MTDTILRFASDDINECRAFLMNNGLNNGEHGWESNEETRLLGSISFWNGQWHAAVIGATAPLNQTVAFPGIDGALINRLADQFRWAVSNDSEGAAGRDGDARIRAWCEVNNAKCDGDAFGMAFTHFPTHRASAEIAAMGGRRFNEIMVETCDLYGLWLEPGKAEVYAACRG